MDRLSTLIAAAVALACLAACDDAAVPAGPAPGRVVAVRAAPQPSLEGFCDVRGGEGAPVVTLPALADGAAASSGGRPRWLNVWATWCHPCVEELPRLAELTGRLREEGLDVELVLLSADASADVVREFRSAHPGIPETLRMADPTELPTWATGIGLDEGATLPMHVFVDGHGRARCLRTGAITESDYPTVRALLRTM